jgi:hypothetical protein
LSAIFSMAAYSESGAGKSTLAKHFLKWLDTSGYDPNRQMRVYTAEHDAAYNKLVKDGRALVWQVDERETPFETLDLAVRGWWPKDLKDPTSPLRPPTKDELNGRIVRIYEGISTFSDFMGTGYASGGLAARGGRGERIGPAEETIKFKDGEMGVGGNPRSHYNVVQGYIKGFIRLSMRLYGYNIWTAHEEKGKDSLTGLPIVGPEVYGQKATAQVPRLFPNVLHLTKRLIEKRMKDGTVELSPDFRLWLKDHPIDPTNASVVFKAKTSMDDEFFNELPNSLEGGAKAIGQFMDLLLKHGMLPELGIGG